MDNLSRIKGLEFRYRKIFGEYCVYANDKVIFTVCDNTVFVKKWDFLEQVMKDARLGVPYPGARENYILDVEDADILERVVWLMCIFLKKN